MVPAKAVALLSGGLDSAVATAIAQAENYAVIALSFRYGQRHAREIASAQKLVQLMGITEHYIVDVPLHLWGASALTDPSISIPTTGIQPDVIPVTYVPGRNTVFIAIALSLAEAKEAEAIYLGINAVDYSGYPDCRPEYLEAYQKLAQLSSKRAIAGFAPKLVAPLIHLSKVEIVRRAIELNVPISDTWSCYSGGEEPCGLCDACRIRDAALIQAGRPDLATAVGRSKWQQRL